MLHTDKLLRVSNEQLETDYSGDSSTSPSEKIVAALGALRRQLVVIIPLLVLGTVLGATYLAIAKPSYTAQSQLIVDTHKLQLQDRPLFGDTPRDAGFVESQLQILQSERLALSVIKDLQLTEDPEFVDGPSGLWKYLPGSNGASDSGSKLQRALDVFQRNLKRTRLGLSYVIEAGFSSHNPSRAAQVSNAVTNAYIKDQLDAKFQTAQSAGDWLQERLRELREQSNKAEREVLDFKNKNNIVTAAGHSLSEDQLSQLNVQLLTAQAQTREAKARLDRIETVIGSADPEVAVNATVTDTLNNPIITRLREQYLEFTGKEADLSARYGANHQAAANLRRQIRDTRGAILDELKRIAETYKSDYEIARLRQESLEKSVSGSVSQSQLTGQAEIRLRELEGAARNYHNIYDSFLQRYMMSVQEQSVPSTEARIITPANVPEKPSAPKPLLVMALASLGGLALGMGAGLFREMLDRVFRTPRQVADNLQLECVAVIPEIDKSAAPKTFLPPVPDPSAARRLRRDGRPMWDIIDAPFSRYAESIRAVKLAADLSGRTRKNVVLGITSSLPNEGKSSVGAALALLCAQVGARVLLVDCDLRNPSLSRALAPEAESGLLEVITGKISLEEAVWNEQTTHLSFLPIVLPAAASLTHSSEILSADGTKLLFDKLRSSYDYIIVDLSPLAPIVDVRATTRFVDSYLFVIEWGKTKIDLAEHALGSARGVYQNIFGAVLNRVSMEGIKQYEGNRGGYYKNKRYGSYLN
jgi:succinoglycan biosynthesis transport protein ExoP